MTTNTSMGTGLVDGTGALVTFVVKTLSAPAYCVLTMSMSAYDCGPGTTGSTTVSLYAAAEPTATNPTCGWNCSCGMVTIDSGDGLPVELMDFAVEDAAGSP